MKNQSRILFIALLALQSTTAFSQNYVDNSYGFLDPSVIYAQEKYFPVDRLQDLKTNKALPTPQELRRLKEGMAQVKNTARADTFSKKIIPISAVTFGYPATAVAVFAVTYVATKAVSFCLAVAPFGLNIFSPLAEGLLVNSAMNLVMSDPGMVDTFHHVYGSVPPTDALMDVEAEYVGHKHLIPHQLQAKAEEMLFSTRLGGTHGGTTASYVRTLIGLRKAQTRSCAITRSWETIEKIIEKGLARNTPELREQVLDLAYSHYQNALTDGESLSRLVAYFNGLPGTGKSRAAKIVAEAFGFPVSILELPGLSPKELWGSEGGQPGALVLKIAELGCECGVLLLEDIDHALDGGTYSNDMASSLLHVFDTTQKSFWSPFLQTQVGTANIFMLLTGNTKLGKQALADRVEMVNFEDYSPETKLAIILEDFLPSLLKGRGIAPADFEGQLPVLKEAINGDKNSGMRTREILARAAVSRFGREKAKKPAAVVKEVH